MKRKLKKISNIVYIDKEEKKIRLGSNFSNSYDIGELLIKFIYADFTEFEETRREIIDVLQNPNELNTELAKIQDIYNEFIEKKKLSRPLTEKIFYNYIEGLSPKEPDIGFYVKYKLYNAIKDLKLEHPYFSVLDFKSFGATDYIELINNKFYLSSIQDLFRIALDYCLNRDCKEELKELPILERYLKFKEYLHSPFEKNRINASFFYDINRDTSNIGESVLLEETIFGYDIASLLYVEFFQMVSLNIRVAKCDYCKQYFILKGMYNSLYCDKIAEGETQTCQQIGAFKKFRKKVHNNPIYNEYERVYKRIYARKRLGKIDESTYEQLKVKINNLRDFVMKGEITLSEYKSEMEKI